MQPLADSQTRINDRFFLGGPLSVRGYRLRGLGPQAARKHSFEEGKKKISNNFLFE